MKGSRIPQKAKSDNDPESPSWMLQQALYFDPRVMLAIGGYLDVGGDKEKLYRSIEAQAKTPALAEIFFEAIEFYLSDPEAASALMEEYRRAYP